MVQRQCTSESSRIPLQGTGILADSATGAGFFCGRLYRLTDGDDTHFVIEQVMEQAITGLYDPETTEMEVRTVWPSIAMYRSGAWLGTLFAIRWPNIYFFRLGYLMAALAIPHALLLYFLRVSPSKAIRYMLTNRRVQIRRGLTGVVERSIDLDAFDDIAIEEKSGYAWYHAGDLVFRKQGLEVFRLAAVVRPDVFRHTCLATRQALVEVRAVRQAQQQPAVA